MRIGLLGGSFNPPHEGHALVTRIALTRLGLDRVWWLVTPGNPAEVAGGPRRAPRAGRGGPPAHRKSARRRHRHRGPYRRALHLRHAGMAHAASAGSPVRLDHGRRQPSAIPSLAPLARHRRPRPDRRRRSAGLDAQGDVQPGRGRARAVAGSGSRGGALRRSRAARVPVPARAALGAFLDFVAEGRVNPLTREELRQRPAPHLAGDDDIGFRVDAVNLEHSFPQIEPDARDRGTFSDRLAHGRLPFRWRLDNDHLGTPMPFAAPSTPSP